MRKQILKALAFILLIVFLFYVNIWVFRTDFPLLWLPTLGGSVVILILFPYKTFFNTKNKN